MQNSRVDYACLWVVVSLCPPGPLSHGTPHPFQEDDCNVGERMRHLWVVRPQRALPDAQRPLVQRQCQRRLAPLRRRGVGGCGRWMPCFVICCALSIFAQREEDTGMPRPPC